MKHSRALQIARLMLALLGAFVLLGPAAHLPTATASARAAHGQVTETTFQGLADGRLRHVWIYTPPADSAKVATERDLLLVFDGGQYLDEIPLPRMLDSLIASRRIPPMVAVLVDDSTGSARLADLANQERFVTLIADELMPWVRERWKVTRDPHRSFITGSSAGGLAAAFLATRRPDLFGNVLSQSGAFWRGAAGSNGPPFEWLTAQIGSSPRRDVRYVLDVGSTESRGAIGGTAPSILDANRRLRDALRARGYEVTYTEIPGGVHAPLTWSPRLPVGLVALAGTPAGR
ncbi:MAG: alpha/beta hydrolase [Candidatus Eiseniibacteriota bacterium]